MSGKYAYDIDLVVVNYHTYDLLQRFLDSIEEFPPKASYKVTIVDVEATLEIDDIDVYDADLVIAYENIGYARACNDGARTGQGEVVALFNADTEFDDADCIDRCLEFLADNDKVGVVGPLQYSHEDLVTHGGIFGTLDAPQHRGWKSNNPDAFRDDRPAVTVSGSAYFIKRECWEDLTDCPIYQSIAPEATGAFLPTRHYYEESFASYHAQAHDWQVWYLGSASMIHRWHQASPIGGTADAEFSRSKEYFVRACQAHGIPHD